jgi:hypothetical protein
VLVEEAAVPAAHLVVRELAGVLDALALEQLGRGFEGLVIDPGWLLPVFVGDEF